MTQEVAQKPQLDEVVQRYVALRDRKAEMKAKFNKEVEAIDAAMNRVELYLLQQLQDMGVESVRTAAGTAYTSTQISVTTADREALIGFAQDNDLWVALDVKPNKTFVQQYKTEHNDLPPGVNWREERTINIRRS